MKKKTFINGALVLVIAGLISKTIGLIYRIPLTNMIGSAGIGLYSYPYTMYATMLGISAVGIPIAISKLVSEKIAHNRHDEAHQIFRTAFFIMLIVGTLSSVLFYLSSKYLISNNWPKGTYYPAMGLVIAPLLIALISVFRGYFHGMNMMIAPSIAQVFDSMGRLVFGLIAASLLIGRGVEYAAGGAALGTTAGAVIGLITIVIIYLKVRPRISREIDGIGVQKQKDSTRDIIKNLLYIAAPISLGAVAGHLMKLIDSLMIPIRLSAAGYSEASSTILWGRIGAIDPLINLSLTISVAIAINLVPAVAAAYTKGNIEDVRNKLNLAIRMGLYIVIPAGIGLFILAEPILNLIFPEVRDSDTILKFLAVSLLFLTINQILTASIQGLGRVYVPVKNLLIGTVFKICISYVLVAIPKLNVNGAIIGTIIGYSIASLLNFIHIQKTIKVEFDLWKILIAPLCSGGVMAISVLLTYNYGLLVMSSSMITLLSVLVGGLVYGIMLIATGGINKTLLKEVFTSKKKLKT